MYFADETDISQMLFSLSDYDIVSTLKVVILLQKAFSLSDFVPNVSTYVLLVLIRVSFANY